MNVFEYVPTGELVSVLKDAPDALVIGANDICREVKRADLRPTKLYHSGVYGEKFMQSALGGITDTPKYVSASIALYRGVKASALVEVLPSGLLKYAYGLPNEAFGPGADALDDMKINKDKQKDWEKEYDDLDIDNDAAVDEDGEPAELDIADEENIGNIKKLTLTWNAPKGDISIADIQGMFGEGTSLPDPDVIKIDTGKETITRKRSSSKKMVKKAYYAPGPMMYRSCPKCQTMFVLKVARDTGVTTMVCLNPKCKNEIVYEASVVPGQGVAGQSKHG